MGLLGGNPSVPCDTYTGPCRCGAWHEKFASLRIAALVYAYSLTCTNEDYKNLNVFRIMDACRILRDFGVPIDYTEDSYQQAQAILDFIGVGALR